jgi:hypothetical protein
VLLFQTSSTELVRKTSRQDSGKGVLSKQRNKKRESPIQTLSSNLSPELTAIRFEL